VRWKSQRYVNIKIQKVAPARSTKPVSTPIAMLVALKADWPYGHCSAFTKFLSTSCLGSGSDGVNEMMFTQE